MSEVDRRILGDAPEGSELEKWKIKGERRDYSNITQWTDPDERYLLEITYDDPVQDFLIRLFRLPDDKYGSARTSERRIAQTLHTDSDRVLAAAARLAAAADELDAADSDPSRGLKYQDMVDVEHPDLTPVPPEEWREMEEKWNEQITDAIEKMGPGRGRPALTVKTIDGKEYYYLQRRADDTVESKYVAPVNP